MLETKGWIRFENLYHSGNYLNHLLQHSELCVLPIQSVYLCVPYGSHNKQRLFP
jgi:hypothetical protein